MINENSQTALSELTSIVLQFFFDVTKKKPHQIISIQSFEDLLLWYYNLISQLANK